MRGLTGPSSSAQTTVASGGGFWCRAPLFSTFWDELWIRGLSPWPDISPAYAFTQEDAPYLATADPYYAHLSGGLSKRIQRPE